MWYDLYVTSENDTYLSDGVIFKILLLFMEYENNEINI